MPAGVLHVLFFAAQAGKPRLPDAIREVVGHDHPIEGYRALELELLRALPLPAAATEAVDRPTLRRFVALAVLYEDRAADVRAQTAVARARPPPAADPAWIADHVPRAELLRDHSEVLGVSADCLGARAAWRLALAQCERGRASRLCAAAHSSVDRLGEPMTTDDAIAQLEVAAFEGAPMGVCGALSFEMGRRLGTQPDVEVAAAVLREYGGRDLCSGARRW